jgi:hypothetical protein
MFFSTGISFLVTYRRAFSVFVFIRSLIIMLSVIYLCRGSTHDDVDSSPKYMFITQGVKLRTPQERTIIHHMLYLKIP